MIVCSLGVAGSGLKQDTGISGLVTLDHEHCWHFGKCMNFMPGSDMGWCCNADIICDLWYPQEEQDGMVQVCHYCRQLCDPDMFSAEPIWSCAWCQVRRLEISPCKAMVAYARRAGCAVCAFVPPARR